MGKEEAMTQPLCDEPTLSPSMLDYIEATITQFRTMERAKQDWSSVDLIGDKQFIDKLELCTREIRRLQSDLAKAREALTWRPTDPNDQDLRLCGLWVQNRLTGDYWEQFLARQDDDGNAVTADGDDIGWQWEDLMFVPLVPAPAASGG